MRLAVVALSTVLLSGCSWMGSGGGYGDSYSYGQGGSYGCVPAGGNAHYGNAGYGFAGGGAGCAGGAGYNVAHGGAGAYGAGAGGGMYGAGAGAGMYGAGAGLRGAYGVNGYGTGLSGAGAGAGMYGAGAGGAGMYGAGGAGMYGAGGAGMYGAGGAGMYGAGGAGMYGAGGAGMYGAAPGAGMYGAGTGGLSGVGGALGTGMAGVGNGLGGLGTGVATLGGAGGVYSGLGGVTTLNGASPYGAAFGGVQTLPGGGTVQTVQGAPIYVPQPYPAYYSAGSYGYNVGSFGGAMPFGIEIGGGQDFFVDGDFFPGEKGKTDPNSLLTVSELAPIGYKDAFDNAKGLDVTATYDVSQNTTLLGRVGYSKADGNLLNIGTVSDGVVTEDLYAEFSDLEKYTIEGGFRQYMGYPTGMRPYIGATAGFTRYDDVDLTQSSATLVDPSVFVQTYADGGWAPTASGVIGAEWALGARSGIGVETGVRWTEALDTNFISDDTVSIPVRLRGRLSF